MIDISNTDLPQAQVIRKALEDLPEDTRSALLEKLTVPEFISIRVDIYLEQLEQAMHAGFDELGAKEIAMKEAWGDLIAAHGQAE